VKSSKSNARPNRSYGHFGHASEICAQDDCTGAITEVLTTRAPPLLVEDCPKSEQEEKEEQALQVWIDKVNSVLENKVTELASQASVINPGKVKIFGRLQVPKKFNAEMDVHHRRIDYMIPADLFYGADLISAGVSLEAFLDSMLSFHPGRQGESKEGHNWKSGRDPAAFTYVYKLKKLMQRFSTQVVDLDEKDEDAVLAKAFHKQKRMKYGKGRNNNYKVDDKPDDAKGKTMANDDKAEIDTEKPIEKREKKEKKQGRVLKRRRFHNFTRTVMAHEFFSYRRLDRFYQRATIRLEPAQGDEGEKRSRPYIVLSLTGDLFLHGQARAIVALLIAIIRGYIDEDILDCVFDEDYTNLVPMPFAPAAGLFGGEVNYASWEGKMNAILTPRECTKFEKGWHSKSIMAALAEFQDEMYKSIARAWDQGEQCGLDSDLPSVSNWIHECLEPWAKRANEQLEDYRMWKAAKDEVADSDNPELTLVEKLVPPVSSVSSDIPTLYNKVLDLLREADSSGSWPSTTPKRQLVMVSTAEGSEKVTSLSVAHSNAKSSTPSSASAYSFKEGQGGASGSFSVGAMPGQQCEPPKGNTLFPELMKAAFELEIALCPEREPSSTIAINRNAQFRPHVDSGAGAGQSRSLIVGIGTYSGGELMVEGEKNDIRYNPLEFNGWTERHWTRPFLGERYSLVWFTPIGCEGVHGIDL